MDERMLLLLGMLKAERQHGYQLNEFIEHNLGRVIDMKRSTAYTLLERLCTQGYVERMTEQEGNRPPRKVYQLTAAGEQQFINLLKELLSQAAIGTPPFEVALMFLDHLQEPEVRALLQDHLEQLNQVIASYEQAPAHSIGKGVDIAISHRMALYRAERTWLVETLEKFM
ncbi:PadR family transcriptional regulator [Tengunoibacter tsumagoiensis]|uniref:PadR family transcriptional regulator n=1 Tax=Tengunoibacter tsumagoiensis TaxID=2014871 RepID=A0A401ZV63_9CHLR|nr:PadR family transcriptional regulator [Tengunoibacter tsumagoiensis]GCE10828.1 PadR family transcriptional regulator [Tengunoibacter tsumagoiensis]